MSNQWGRVTTPSVYFTLLCSDLLTTLHNWCHRIRNVDNYLRWSCGSQWGGILQEMWIPKARPDPYSTPPSVLTWRYTKRHTVLLILWKGYQSLEICKPRRSKHRKGQRGGAKMECDDSNNKMVLGSKTGETICIWVWMQHSQIISLRKVIDRD